MTDIAYFVIAVAICGGMMITAARMEPHWASKDGRRCICQGQVIDRHGLQQGRWSEYRVEVLDDGTVEAKRRGLLSRSGAWSGHVLPRDDSAGKRVVFVLRTDDSRGDMLLLRLPRKSNAVDVLDAVAEH
jgi:hypothetical protein